MTTLVTGKNQVTIPAEVSRELGITRGSCIEWKLTPGRRQVVMVVMPSRGELARSAQGAGKKYIKPGDDLMKELITMRESEDKERNRQLEGKH